MGKGVALDLILSGEMAPAADALRMGLVSRVVPLADLRATAEKLAKTILSRGPLALRSALAAVHEGLEMPQDKGLQYEASLFGLLAATQDMQEGMGAFLEKRQAHQDAVAPDGVAGHQDIEALLHLIEDPVLGHELEPAFAIGTDRGLLEGRGLVPGPEPHPDALAFRHGDQFGDGGGRMVHGEGRRSPGAGEGRVEGG